MREIGSEFWNIPTISEKSHLFPEHTQWYLSGRCALQAIIRELKQYRTIAMPSWCCESMIKPFADAGLIIYFYPVYWKEGLIQEIRTDCDILFLMDYFGFTGPQPDIDEYTGIVIRDMTQSLFSAQRTDADYYFGSLRKWGGIWTGGFAWTEDGKALYADERGDEEYILLREKAMRQKEAYINAIEDSNGKCSLGKDFLEIFHAAEERLEKAGIAPAAERDKKTADRLNTALIRKSRRTNAAVLMNGLPELLFFREMKETDCPLFVPICVPDGRRDELRNYLIRKEIYCPVHWPVSAYHSLNTQTEIIYRSELSLVCDQRYSEEDMNRIIDTVNAFRGGL